VNKKPQPKELDMKTLSLCLVMVGFLIAMAHTHEACLCKKHQDHVAQAKATRVQGHPVGPTTPSPTQPSAFGGDKGTLWTLAQTVHNQ